MKEVVVTEFCQWAVDWFDQMTEDACRFLGCVLDGLMFLAGSLFALMTIVSLFG